MTELFTPLRTETAYQQVCTAIQDKILSRALNAGDPLPSETELARQFGVNRSTVREALRTLESFGLVMRPPGGKRLRVSQPRTEQVAASVGRALLLQDVTFLQVWEAMMLIEPELAALAAHRRTADQLGGLHTLAQVMAARPLSAEAAVDTVAGFFRLLGNASGNRALEMAGEPLTGLLRPTLRRMIDRVPQARDRISVAQAQLITALEQRNAAGARDWMGKHIRDFRRGYELAGIRPDERIETAAQR